jgi:hypothetical protein
LQNNNITVQVVGLVLSLILGIGLVGIPTALAQPDYTKLNDASAEKADDGKMKLTVTTGADIPRKPDDYINSVPVFGYAWLDGGKAIVAVIHPTFDDSAQNPKSWHTHPVTLDSDNCITDLGKSQGGISIQGNILTLQISVKQAGNINPDTAASFEVHPDNDCPPPEGSDQGLKVKVLDTTSIS